MLRLESYEQNCYCNNIPIIFFILLIKIVIVRIAGASASWRFRSPEVEPYMNSQGKGLPWFSVQKVRGRGL
jgi:hypothetical protein